MLDFKQSIEPIAVEDILESITDAFFSVDNLWRFVYFNHEAEKMMNIKRQEVLGKTFMEVFPCVVESSFFEVYKKAMEDKKPVTYEGYFEPLESWYEVRVFPKEKGLAVYVRNINERKQRERNVKVAYSELDQIFNTSTEAICVIDKDYNVIRANKTYTDMYGVTKEEYVGTKCYSVFTSKNCNTSDCPVVRIFNGEDKIDVEIEKVNKQGKKKYFLATATPFLGPDGEILGIVENLRDISERRRAEETITFMAYHDQLTGLPNRRKFSEEITCSLSRSEAINKRVAVMFLDLDCFKEINDIYGHDKGDELLVQVAKVLKTCLGDKMILARMGGDEFTVIIPEVALIQDVTIKAEEILRIFSKPIDLDGQEISVSTSIGIAIYPEDGKNAEDLLKKADMAMYYAKEQGKNNYQYYTSFMTRRNVDKYNKLHDLRQAIQKEQFSVYYQPQVNIITGKVIGVEALIRWHHPIKGLIPPNDFIGLAEETGLILPIGEWVLKTACLQNKLWQDEGLPPMRVAVNLSGRQLKSPDLVEKVAKTLKETKLDPKWLELEITERVVMYESNGIIKALNQLKEMGIRLALDDFGTGFSTLNRLKAFPIDRLKIDRAFIKDITENYKDAAIVNSIIDLARNLEIDLIAEGVEMVEHVDFLKGKNCIESQGYFYSKPLPLQEIDKLLWDNLIKSS